MFGQFKERQHEPSRFLTKDSIRLHVTVALIMKREKQVVYGS